MVWPGGHGMVLVWPDRNGEVYDLASRAWHVIWYDLEGVSWLFVWPGGHDMASGMVWQALYVIWYGMADIAWQAWHGACHGTWYGLAAWHVIWYGITLQAWYDIWFGLAIMLWYMVWPGGPRMVHSMACWASHGI